MGRHRTARAKDKLIRSTTRKLDNKRNRDTSLRAKRADFQRERADRIRRNQKVLYGDGPDVSAKKGDLQKVKKQINEKFLERVEKVQSSYSSFFGAVDESQAVIEVLDARDPYSFRYVDMEQHVIKEGKKLFLVITKIDLVPAEAVVGWIASLSGIAPTVAVCATEKESTNTIISQMIGDLEKVSVVGAPGVGKTSLCEAVGERLVDTQKWEWTMCNNSLGLTNSVPWKGRIREFAVDTLERVQGEVVFTLMGIKMENTPGNALVAYARKLGVAKQEAPEKLIECFVSGAWKWYSAAPDRGEEEDKIEVSEIQRQILEKLCHADDTDYVVLGKGELVRVDKNALEFEVPKDNADSDDSDSDEDEEEDEKDE